jgi:hypothetical protein
VGKVFTDSNGVNKFINLFPLILVDWLFCGHRLHINSEWI